ncbi:MAG: phosphoribosyltransferase [Nitrospirae bacterium]|nr:MAG: phosphoribosyltransferase [Nitrospirota bacterium]
MGELIEDIKLRGKSFVFRDRAEAGKLLAEMLSDYESSDTIILAIPAGGVPVAYEIARRLKLLMDVLIVRKIQIPGNTEAGFGAMGPDGEVIFNQSLMRTLRLTKEEILQQVDKTRKVLEARDRLYRGGRQFPELSGKDVILVDDGLASGYTTSAAVGYAEKRNAKRIIAAVPTASDSSINLILPLVDKLYCLNIRGYPFAVAEAYEKWYDLSDEEVSSLLRDVRGK